MRRFPLLALFFSLPAAAQSVTITAPPLFVLPNEGRNPAGQIEGIEGGAYTARASDVGAVYYNPAGLGLSKKSSVSAASAAYEWTFYTGEVGEVADTGSRLSSNGRLFGFVVGSETLKSEKLSLGFAIPTPVSWKPTLQLSGALPAGGGAAGLLYSADGSYSDIVPTIAAGWALTPGLRLGASAGVSFLTLTQTQEQFAQAVVAAGGGATQRTFRADGTSYDLILTGGLQWDLSPTVTLGVVAAAPGLRLGGSSGLFAVESTATAAGYRSVAFRDPEAEFAVKHPAKVSVGLSWRFARGEVEADLKYVAGASAYELFSSPVAGAWTSGSGSSASSGPAIFTPAYDERSSVTNFAVGGRYDVSPKTSVHLGVFTAFSPVGEKSVFTAVDVYGVSAGVSLNWAHVSGSLGFAYEWGNEVDPFRDEPQGSTPTGELGITSVHLLWGLTYKF